MTEEQMIEFENPENSAFKFSGVDTEDNIIDSDEYTEVYLAQDVSPSTEGIRTQLKDVVVKTVEAIKESPRAEKIMLHMSQFGTGIEEVHGYKPMTVIDPGDYKELPTMGRSTSLYDSIYYGLNAAEKYANALDQNDIGSNAILFIITDGMENSSSVGAQTIIDKLKEIRMNEVLESVKIIIIGIIDPDFGDEVREYLKQLCDNLGLDQYVEVTDMSVKEVAKLGGFISQSVSAQSQSLGTGGPSQNLTF